MDSEFGCRMTHTKILPSAKVLFTFIPARAWGERQGLRFVTSLSSETDVNRDTKIVPLYWPRSSLCAVFVFISQVLSEDTSSVPAWPLMALPVSSSWETKVCIQALDLPFGTGDHKEQRKAALQHHPDSGSLALLSLCLGGMLQQEREGGISHRTVCTNTPDILLNKFVVYTSDELLG